MAFGRKNSVNIDPLSYNICLLGESKIGKSTLVKEMCEKLTNYADGGYLFLECGQERGADAIEGINYINCPEYHMDYDELTNSAGFSDVCEDIIANKNTEYKNLRVVIWDTYDQLIKMAEDESIRLWNKECREKGSPEKVVSSINGAWSGFGRGEKKAIDIMFDMMARLRSVGVSTFVIGHVKNKDITDAVTGETYQTLTSDQQQNYFNALKKNLHFLGLAYIDRQIVKENGKKNPVTGKEKKIGRVKSETRKIKFRDDNYAVDSGCRFAEIVNEIQMDADAFIDAIKDAIECERKKSGKTVAETIAEQTAINNKFDKRVAKREEENRAKKAIEDIVNKIVSYCADNQNDISKIKPILAKCKDLGYSNPKEICNLDDANAIYAECK